MDRPQVRSRKACGPPVLQDTRANLSLRPHMTKLTGTVAPPPIEDLLAFVGQSMPQRLLGRAVVCGLVFAALWLSLLGATSLTPPIDNIEQLTWVRSLEWG